MTGCRQPDGQGPHRLAGALSVLLVAALLVIGHPAGGALAETGRIIAASNTASLRGIALFGVVDAAAPAAAAILLVSVLVAGALGSALLAGPATDERTSTRVPIASLLGHAGGAIAALLGGGGLAFYGTAGLVAAAILLRPAAPGTTAPRWRRIAPLLLLAALLFLAAGGVDGLLQSALGGRPFPEAWFVLAAESGGGLRLPVLATLAAVALAAAGMESRREGNLLFAAAAWALLLGPSNPCRALALAWSLRCLARAGLPAALRAAVVAVLVAGMAALVLA